MPVIARHRVPATGKHTVKTNTIKDSVVCLHIEAITFKQLWDNYVTGDPISDTKTYPDQCAIRMSATFHKVGVPMASFSEKVITSSNGPGTKIGRVMLDGKPAATRASELAQWLKLKPFCGLPAKPENITGADWESKVKGRTGIIMFDHYWARTLQEKDPSGGHIDLWNGSRLTISSAEGLLGVIGRGIGLRSAHIPRTTIGYSDLSQAKIILFWEIK